MRTEKTTLQPGLVERGYLSLRQADRIFRTLRGESEEQWMARHSAWERLRAGFGVGFHMERGQKIMFALLREKDNPIALKHARKMNARIIKLSAHENLYHHAASNRLSYVGGEALGMIFGKLFPIARRPFVTHAESSRDSRSGHP